MPLPRPPRVATSTGPRPVTMPGDGPLDIDNAESVLWVSLTTISRSAPPSHRRRAVPALTDNPGTLMRMLWTTVAILGVVTAGTAAASAQGRDDQYLPLLLPRTIPLVETAIHAPEIQTADPDERQHDLETWIHDFSEWRDWRDQWGNRREPGWFSESRRRRQRPDPPDWLFDRCEDSVEDTGQIAEACALLVEWSAGYPTLPAPPLRVASSPTNEEKVDKTIWWEHVHLDAGWPAMQSGVTLFGVVGVHATTNVRGRLEVFVAPGAMLLNVPTRDGRRAWKLATNYGIGYRLLQFKFPGNRQALLHVNLAKAWLLATGPDVESKSTDFVGFSVTFKKKP